MSVDSSHLPIIRLRHWNADSATKGSIALAHWEERSKFNRVWCSEHADLDKTNRTNFTEGLSPACAGVEVGSILAARERLIQESPHWAQTVFNISPAIWWIYPDFTSDIPPHSQSGLPLTPINSVWAGYSKVSQMFWISDADSAPSEVTQLTFGAEKFLFALWKEGLFIYLWPILAPGGWILSPPA